jgi:hypothetical protein
MSERFCRAEERLIVEDKMKKLTTAASVTAVSLLCWMILLPCFQMTSSAQETEKDIVGTWIINVTAAPTFPSVPIQQ